VTRTRTKAAPARPIVSLLPIARPAVARVDAPAVTPLPAEPPIKPTVVPPPVAIQPARPAPTLVADSDSGLVTTEPLAPRRVNADEGGLGHAVAAVASLRPMVGILSLAAAFLGLASIWWQSLGARMWHARRRKAQPRLMIDIPLAADPKIAFDRESA
jgi:hypothetical protein